MDSSTANNAVDSIPDPPTLPRRWGVLISLTASGFVLVGAATLALLPAALLGNWFPTLTDEEKAVYLGPAAQIVLLGLGGMIAVVGVALSLARHREELRASVRAEAALELDRAKERSRQAEVDRHRRMEEHRLLRERFVSSVELLSDGESATRRSAGLYAIASVANAWLELGRRDESQVCIDVLCGYLRAPLGPELPATAHEEVAVRRTGYELIRRQLVASDLGLVPWWGFRFNLAGAHIDFSVNLAGILVGADTQLVFEQATVCRGGSITMDNSSFGGTSQVSFANARFHDGGRLSLADLDMHGSAQVLLSKATVARSAIVLMSGAVLHDAASLSLSDVLIEEGAQFVARSSVLRGHSVVKVARPILLGGGLVLDGLQLEDEAELFIRKARLDSGAKVSILRMNVSGKAMANVTGATLNGASVLDATGSRVSAHGRLAVEESTIVDGKLSLAASRFSGQSRTTLSIDRIGKGRVSVERIEALEDSVIVIDGARFDDSGRIWLGPEALNDPGAIFLGRMSRGKGITHIVTNS